MAWSWEVKNSKVPCVILESMGVFGYGGEQAKWEIDGCKLT